MAMQMSDAQFKELLATLGSVNIKKGSFSGCTARFNGNTNSTKVEEFITVTTIYKDIEKINDGDALTGLPLLLENNAATWWQGVKSTIITWTAAMDLLRKTFSPLKPAYKIYQEVFEQKQQKHSSTDLFICDKRALFSQIPNVARPNEQMQLDMVYGLLHIDIRQAVPRDSFLTYEKLLEKTRAAETILSEKKDMFSGNITSINRKNKPRDVRCDFCTFRGHTEAECRKKSSLNAARTTTQIVAKNDEKQQIVCYGCGKAGVFRSNCVDCNKKPKSTNINEIEFYSMNTKLGRNVPQVRIQINGFVGVANIDTAARMSVASKQLYRRLMAMNWRFSNTIVNIRLADGSCRPQQSKLTSVNIEIGGRKFKIKMIALPEADENRTLLGIDFLEDARIILNAPQRAWCFADSPNDWNEYDEYEPNIPNEIPHLLKTTRQPTTSEFIQPIKRKPEPEPPSSKIETETKSIFIELAEGRIEANQTTPKKSRDTSFTSHTPGITPILKQMASNELLISPIQKTPKIASSDIAPQQLEKTPTTICKEMIQPNILLSPIPPTPAHATIDISSIEIELRHDEANHITMEEKEKLNELICINKNLFQINNTVTPYIKHFIKTKENCLPIASPPYRLSPAKKDILKSEIKKMLEASVIEESDSPWAAPVVMVPKKDGSTRVCIDYRRLNEITIPDRYPLPRIDDLLHEARSSPYMTTMDLRSGYWQIEVNEEDRDKTAFITPMGMFQFIKMPFGLRNAPATFQRLMDRFMNGLPDISILVYLDDIIIRSTSLEQHVADLKMVFQRLEKFNLQVNREKSHFCCKNVNYLGHVITTDGVKTNPEKTKAIAERAPPKNVKQLLSFIQTCSWYRRFIENFAEIAQPLTKLTKKTAVWLWEKEQQEAFDTLKIKLTTSPILIQANEKLPYILKTDASNYALGAALLQGEGANEHPIEYASRLLHDAELNYSTTEKEALAVIWAVEHFRGYIEGAKIIIATDHQPLRWLMSLKSPSGRLARWALRLQPYDLHITYIPGKTNVLADTLSRPPCEQHSTEIEECTICSVQFDLPHRGEREVREKQLEDDYLKDIISSFEDTSDAEKFQRWTHRGYMLHNGVLYKYTSDEEEAVLVIPSNERQEILNSFHNDATAGHYGIERTIARIASRFYWPKMRTDITQHIGNCIECQRYKATNLKPAGLFQTTASEQRFETIAIDFFGPLPETEEGYKHIFIIEDTASKWVEIFPLKEATAEACADILLHEIFMRFGLPRRVISDNGPQFISAIIQKLMFCLNITHILTPVYHPQSNPVERKNRDLKPQLAILVDTDHTQWSKNLSAVRFAMNTVKSSSGFSAAYLTFGRELRSPKDVEYNLKEIISSENFIPQITPVLLRMSDTLDIARENTEAVQDRNNRNTDPKRRSDPNYAPGDLVWIDSHTLSNSSKQHTAKFNPRRDGPYVIHKKIGASSYQVANRRQPDNIIGCYHTSAITPARISHRDRDIQPVQPIRKRGRPKKTTTAANAGTSVSSRGGVKQ